MHMCKKLCNFAAEMAKTEVFHRALSWVRHKLSAWNTTGEGIHSPYLFYLVRFVLRDRNAYYCFRAVEQCRSLLLRCPDELDVVDYGSGGSREGLHVRRRVCDIARRHLESATVGQMLFRLANYLCEEQHRPIEILELGTSLGITTAYLGFSGPRNSIVTLEGSEAVARIARAQWRMLGLKNIECDQGNIDDTLYIHAREKIDLAYIDANHTYEATMRYAGFLLPRLTEKGVMVVDDIHYSREMERAWQELKNAPQVSTSMDMYHIGLLFVDPHYLKRHYRINL